MRLFSWLFCLTCLPSLVVARSLPDIVSIDFQLHCQSLADDSKCQLECLFPNSLEEEDCQKYPIETVLTPVAMELNRTESEMIEWWPAMEESIRMKHHVNIVNKTMTVLKGDDSIESDVTTRSVLVELLVESDASRKLEIQNLIRNNDRPMDGNEKKKEMSWFVWIGGCFIVVGIVGIVGGVTMDSYKRTRKRRMVHVPSTFFPPMEKKQNDENASPYPVIGNISAKRPRFEQTMANTLQAQQRQASVLGSYVHLPNVPFHPSTTSMFRGQTMRAVPGVVIRMGFRTDIHNLICDWTPMSPDDLTRRVTDLINRGISIDAQDENEETALLLAVRAGNYLAATVLLRLGADPTVMNKYNSTCIHQAVLNADLNMLRLLLSDKRAVNKPVENGDRSIDAVDHNDMTALMLCAQWPWKYGRAMVGELLAKGADPAHSGDKSCMKNKGRTALHYAALQGNPEMTEFLLKLPTVDKDAEDTEGKTALYLAVDNLRYEVVAILLDNGVDCHITDGELVSPKELAKRKGSKYLMEALEVYIKKRMKQPANLSRTVAQCKSRSSDKPDTSSGYSSNNSTRSPEPTSSSAVHVPVTPEYPQTGYSAVYSSPMGGGLNSSEAHFASHLGAPSFVKYTPQADYMFPDQPFYCSPDETEYAQIFPLGTDI